MDNHYQQLSISLMRQLRIKSLESLKYHKFKQFCKEKVHFIFGIKKSMQTLIILSTFNNALTKRINVHL